jgi:hypothetical protein
MMEDENCGLVNQKLKFQVVSETPPDTLQAILFEEWQAITIVWAEDHPTLTCLGWSPLARTRWKMTAIH